MDELFHDSFREDYAEARARIDKEAAESRELALNIELGKLDSEYQQEALQKFTAQERRRTLSFASSVSLLLSVNHIRPEIEHIASEPVFETKGFIRKKEVQVGTRQRIALEGWPLEIEDRSFSTVESMFGGNKIVDGTLVLTMDENLNQHPPLVWHRGHIEVAASKVTPLPGTPLASTDIQWYLPPEKPQKMRNGKKPTKDSTIHDMINFALINPPSKYIDAEVDPEYLEELKQRQAKGIRSSDFRQQLEEGRLLNQQPDYQTYIEAGIERKIQKALVQIVAKYKLAD